MSRAISVLTITGVLLVVLGISGWILPVFTTQRTLDVAQIGDLKVQTQESTSHVIPPLASGGALLLNQLLAVFFHTLKQFFMGHRRPAFPLASEVGVAQRSADHHLIIAQVIDERIVLLVRSAVVLEKLLRQDVLFRHW